MRQGRRVRKGEPTKGNRKNKENVVSEPFYTARARLEKVGGVHRRARLEEGTEIDFGVHGPIKSHYRIDAKDLPLPVDYQVAATGA